MELLLAVDSSTAITRDIFGFTPLHWAAVGGHLCVVKQLFPLIELSDLDNTTLRLFLLASRQLSRSNGIFIVISSYRECFGHGRTFRLFVHERRLQQYHPQRHFEASREGRSAWSSMPQIFKLKKGNIGGSSISVTNGMMKDGPGRLATNVK